MHILYVINSLRIGGAEKICVDLIKLEIKEGLKIDVYILNDTESIFTEELRDLGVNIFSSHTKNLKSHKHLLWLLKNMSKYDLIHSHLSYSQYFVGVLRLFNKKVRLITTEHNTFNERRKYKTFKFIERALYNAYNEIIVINEENKKYLLSWQRNIENKVFVIENGIDIERYKNGDRKKVDDPLLREESKKKILMVAAFRKQKNHKLLIEALKYLNEDNILILVGDGRIERKEKLIECAKEHGVEHRVNFLGKRSDVENIMKCCDLFVLPSLWEGFGLVAAEAMAAGIPVIASNVEGLSQVVSNGGVLFENNNVEDLSKKISCILRKSPKEIEFMKEAGIKKSMNYSINKTFEKHIKLYKEGRL